MTRISWIRCAVFGLLAPSLNVLAEQTPLQQEHSSSSSTSSASGSSSIDIWHRVIPYASGATETDPSWSKRGRISMQGGQATWLSTEKDAFATLSADEGDLYQIGFEARHSPLDSGVVITNFVSVPECHLHTESAGPLKDTITLNVQSREDCAKPVHLSYKVHGAQVTRCQPGSRATSFNTTIRLSYPDTIASPRLHQPVMVNYQPDGTVKEPEPEKSFIQKYWMWIVPILLLLMTSGGGGEEEGAAPPARR
ncbi:hypothetical protein P389DRAFT_165023 [Cystobasidium minutum MCA 4210]|uniref:uncharacterized protein n=1 Tax=Cystobasidium minutum MCA 4210 TaxID=1397322 RepID=UPI0034D01270|eukprot:jgi/Rhomi1/165023/fgenesh1_kg.1_\